MAVTTTDDKATPDTMPAAVRLIIALLMIAFALPGATAQTKENRETLIWFVWNLPPEFIPDGKWKGQGYADKFLAFFIKNLPEYNHKIEFVNVARWSREALEPNRCTAHLWGGFFPDQLILSEPYTVTPPQVGIFPAKVQEQFGPPNTRISLKHLLKDTYLMIAIISLDLDEGALQSRYPILHPLLAPYVNTPKIIEQNSNLNVPSLKLLDYGRADYLIGYPSTITAQKRVFGFERDYVAYYFEEHHFYKKIYAACSKTSAGQKVINRVNSLLTEDTHREFLSYHEEWNMGDPEFRRTIIDYFINKKPLTNVVD
ncbi:MAG: hypothetical protein AB3N28_11015 [Kordiimonas sp.]